MQFFPHMVDNLPITNCCRPCERCHPRRLLFNRLTRAIAIRGADWLYQHDSHTKALKEAIAGHVTAGGTVCLEALSQSGSRDAWQPSYDVVSVLQLVLALIRILPHHRKC